MHYLIDGYNLLFFFLPPDDDLQEKREKLISLLDEKLSSLNIKVTLIFDGFHTSQPSNGQQYFKSLKVIFTQQGKTADEYILEYLNSIKYLKEYTVITADKNLSQQIKSMGSLTKTPNSFLKWLLHKETKKEKTPQKKHIEETKENIEKLLLIFEKRLQESEFEL